MAHNRKSRGPKRNQDCHLRILASALSFYTVAFGGSKTPYVRS